MPARISTCSSPLAMLRFNGRQRILRICFFENCHLSTANVRVHFECVNRITGDQPHFALIDFNHAFSYEESSLELFANGLSASSRIATAYYTIHPLNRLFTNFLNLHCRRSLRLAVFSDKKEARQWLSQQKVIWANQL